MEKLVLCGRAVAYHSRAYSVTPSNGGECCTNGDVCPSDIDAAGRIRYLIKQNDQAGIVAFLTCLDEVWAYRILVTTLIDQGKYSQALTNLLRIPDNSADNIEFKAMCNAIIANLQSGANVGGRQNTQALQQLRTIAQTRQSTQTALAQSTLALLQGDDYVRASAPIEAEKGEGNSLTTFEQLIVVPNPAQNYAQIICSQAIPNAKLLIYTTNGQLLKTISNNNSFSFTVDLSTFTSGLYYCYVENTPYRAKLVVVK
ncbi:MAG TPA: T9SS type A sorting domain-containing protein [Chitinophagales bacterium]|nr:T9SS type A sorting domain-containing protein [Chitinophagales bacterium]